jgi:hypothetical protein
MLGRAFLSGLFCWALVIATPQGVLIKPLHSKTASKAGASLWIPAGRAAPAKTGKN